MPKLSSNSSKSTKKMRPALSPEARENQMIALAMDLAEQQLRDGTASSQLITEFVKRGSVKAREEIEKLKRENKLLEAKAKAIESTEEIKVLYEKAIKAFRNYNGQDDMEEYEDY